MFEQELKRIRQGIETAFVDKTISSQLTYRPQLVMNNRESNDKVIATLQRELLHCDFFQFSVAFITESGIEGLLGTFKELEKRNIQGRILTTDYLSFTEPKALYKLASLSNIEIKLFETQGSHEGFHTKGYMFREGDIYKIIVGSANLTQSALSINKEWNTKVISTKDGDYADRILSEFSQLWNHPLSKPWNEVATAYEAMYMAMQQERRRTMIASESKQLAERPCLVPNSMQQAFADRLVAYVEEGRQRALLLSATGTGKTYAAAFAMQRLEPRRVLFLVHREQIARQAKASFGRVLGHEERMGLLSGSSKDYEADFLFATVQSMSQEYVYSQFKPDYFDVIIIDEVHRAGARTYQRLIDYFTPTLWLGMTASPERTDGFNIFELFHHTIAQEIRLEEALEDRLLCPFHYFGITAYTDDDGEQRTIAENGATSVMRMDIHRATYIMEQANYYGYSGKRVKGLIFCSRNEEAQQLAGFLAQLGVKAIALSGADSQERREQCITRLCDDDVAEEERLEYLITVDIFNEGVDIPEINQVLLLRPTESPIVFVQQLGRGLRKHEDKEFVVILDFIGNYTTNFMIPLALSGDRSYRKDTMRRYVMEGTRLLPGCSTMYFDEISKQRIFESIDAARFDETKFLVTHYRALKEKLGRIPDCLDFERHGDVDICLFINKFRSYYHFLVKKEPEYTVRLPLIAEEIVAMVAERLADGKRPHELLILKHCIKGVEDPIGMAMIEARERYGLVVTSLVEQSCIAVLTGSFFVGAAIKKYANAAIFTYDSGVLRVRREVQTLLVHNREFTDIVRELVDLGLYLYETKYSKLYKDTPFQLYQSYTYTDVCRLLAWKKDCVPLNIGGYKYDEYTKSYPVFINYNKAEDISSTTKYEDRFIDPANLIAISKSNRTLQSDDVQRALHADEEGVAMHLFVRKNKNDAGSKEFYYLGRIHASSQAELISMQDEEKKRTVSAVELWYRLETPVRDDIYEYITGD